MVCFLACHCVSCDVCGGWDWVAEDVVQSGGGVGSVVGSPSFLSGLWLWYGVQVCLCNKMFVHGVRFVGISGLSVIGEEGCIKVPQYHRDVLWMEGAEV